MAELQHWSHVGFGVLGLVAGVYMTLWALHIVSPAPPDTNQTRHFRKVCLVLGPFEIIYGIWRLFW